MSVFTPSPVFTQFLKLLDDLDAMIAAERRFETVAADLSFKAALSAAEAAQDALTDGLSDLLSIEAPSQLDQRLRRGALVLHTMMQCEDPLAFRGIAEAARMYPAPFGAAEGIAGPGQIDALLVGLRHRISAMAELLSFSGDSAGSDDRLDPGQPGLHDFSTAPV